MLCPMILEYPLNILHAGNSHNIGYKNKQPQYTFHEIQENRILCNAVKKLGCPSRNSNKQNSCQHKGKSNGSCQLPIRKLFLLFPSHLGRIPQGANTNNQGFYQGHTASQQGLFQYWIPIANRINWPTAYLNFALRGANCCSCQFRSPHHNSFNNSLTADSNFLLFHIYVNPFSKGYSYKKRAGQSVLLSQFLFCVTLVELLNTTTSCDITLTTGEERMALGANINSQLSLSGASSEGVAATADNLCLKEFWMNTVLHIYTPRFFPYWAYYKSSLRRLGPT